MALRLVVLALAARPSLQHGRMMEPPSRASMWRVGFPTPKVVRQASSGCMDYMYMSDL
jgi:hypothetical protein